MNNTAIEKREHEERRLAALRSYDVLDTPREAEFDAIAQLASEICGTPIAVVNLIADHRQFFKAEVGLGVRETPFESSFCAKAILEEDFLLVPDASKDPRFDCNPLVTGSPHLRFYAGALLKTQEGLPIGTVCVLDYEPKQLNETQQRTLRVLAQQVMTQLELRRLLKAQAHEIAVERRLSARRQAQAIKLSRIGELAQQEQERFKSAQGAGRIGIFEVDVPTGNMTVSEEFCRIFGVAVQTNYTASTFESLIVEEDRAVSSDDKSRSGGTAELDVEYRIRRANDQSLRWIARRARFTVDQGGISHMVGIVLDVTDSKQRDLRTQCLLSLGDQLREVTTIKGAAQIAAEVLAEGLGVGRTGYATIDRANDAFVVEFDWSNDGELSFGGRHPLSAFNATAERLALGETLAVPNVPAAPWLGGDAEGYAAFGVRSFIKVPILEAGALIGVLFAHDDTPRFWTSDEMTFAWGVADRTYAAIAKLRAEAQQAVLNEELSHRLKNTLAMVQAIAGQTLKNVTERDAVEAFVGRLQSLSAAHDVLLQQSWSAARIRDIVEEIARTHAEPGRITIAGPDINIGPKAALSLSLILHELATNAAKYGSLSNDVGLVDISWRVEGSADGSRLEFRWEEKDGPLVREPLHRGFGSRLIRMGLAGSGDVDKRYLSTGLIAVFRAPMGLVQEWHREADDGLKSPDEEQ
ncbi:hypothetical protein K32_23740 [Kaistia sp. 32K]|uniref:GAF domain-containing protein n=1 Tax=Kaistia sp. 32K TaxID=2795690 RepID=UPI00191533AE|nr:GAF domain-containing protein [Kaistia sp. 32K]BCP53757.1 hypothetical protein K32_23740 [Kaistia sp. 32K]